MNSSGRREFQVFNSISYEYTSNNIKIIFKCFVQVMDDRWESEVLEYGAINITGFRIVDTNRPVVKQFLNEWADFEVPSHGPKRQTISVRLFPFFMKTFTSYLHHLPTLSENCKTKYGSDENEKIIM